LASIFCWMVLISSSIRAIIFPLPLCSGVMIKVQCGFQCDHFWHQFVMYLVCYY
jgi:hypothetical protein